MSSIWHDPLEIPLFDDTVVFIDDLGDWHTGYTQRDNDGITDHDSGEIYTEENVFRWAYIKDLLALETELIRTRKALEIAVDVLKDNLSQANFREMLDASRFHCIRTKCESALSEITALEQKD